MALCPSCGAHINTGATRCLECFAVFPANAALPDNAAAHGQANSADDIFDDPTIFDVDTTASYPRETAEQQYGQQLPTTRPKHFHIDPAANAQSNAHMSQNSYESSTQTQANSRGYVNDTYQPTPYITEYTDVEDSNPAPTAEMSASMPRTAEPTKKVGGTAAMVFAVLSLVFQTSLLCPLLAIILGHIAYRKYSSERAWTARLIGIVTFIVRLVTIISITITMMLFAVQIRDFIEHASLNLPNSSTYSTQMTDANSNASHEANQTELGIHNGNGTTQSSQLSNTSNTTANTQASGSATKTINLHFDADGYYSFSNEIGVYNLKNPEAYSPGDIILFKGIGVSDEKDVTFKVQNIEFEDKNASPESSGHDITIFKGEIVDSVDSSNKADVTNTVPPSSDKMDQNGNVTQNEIVENSGSSENANL